MQLNILLRHNYILVSAPAEKKLVKTEPVHLATVAMNLSYYGYSLDVAAYKAITNLSLLQLEAWWAQVEPQLKSITGEDRKMGDFVVYKNFPTEVLEKSQAEYWIAQILMYWGLPNELFTQDVKPRTNMAEQPRLTILRLANDSTLLNILNSYVQATARWKAQELKDVIFLAEGNYVDFSKMTFKENLVSLATDFIKRGKDIQIKTATDVLRLGAGLSDGDVSLREKVKFKKFSRKTRRYILSMLERCNNLGEDVARRSELWKRFLHNLHAGDYKKQFPNVCAVMDDLYHDRLTTFNSKVEVALALGDEIVLDLLSTRPGDFRRRLVHTLDLFGNEAVKSFTSSKVLSKLNVTQLVTLRRFLETANSRNHRTFPPKGNWGRLQLGEPRKVVKAYVTKIGRALDAELSQRVPMVKMLYESVDRVKLPSNDGEVSPYARGTVFPIPEGVDFIRAASYWQAKIPGHGNVWFDNGWNFFDENWQAKESCCWTNYHTAGKGAIFSGDPTNSKEMEGKACQMIDLYLSKLKEQGVRYGVWNILCYSQIPFSNAKDVFAALQWGQDATSGKLFEPSRCQLAFPLKGKSLTKYVCYIDLHLRELVYMDANLKGSTYSAAANEATLEKQMPAYVEYLNSLPSVYDLFRESVDTIKGKGYVTYSDKDLKLPKNASAYIFRPENESNTYKEIDLNAILSAK